MRCPASFRVAAHDVAVLGEVLHGDLWYCVAIQGVFSL